MRVWPALRFNKVVLGFDASRALAERAAGCATCRPTSRPLRELLVAARCGRSEPVDDPWTDDHAPVEWVTDRMIVAVRGAGGELDEDYLPTRP